jgi:hypothetical protein
MWPWKLKLDDEKSKRASLAQQNGFGKPSCAQFIETGKRHSTA